MDRAYSRGSRNDRKLFLEAWRLTRARHGDLFTFYLPGMIRYGRERGRYPAVSITGDRCLLQCDHCRGRLLQPMIQVNEPQELLRTGKRLHAAGAHGLLLSGGSNLSGRLPWELYYDAIALLVRQTGLFLSAHIGFPDVETCRRLRDAGIRQALVDVIGDELTARKVYHLAGAAVVSDSLESITESGLPMAPHVVAGLYYGRLRGETEAVEIISRHRPQVLVFVVLTPLKGTPMEKVSPPSPLEVARLIALARISMPDVPISLGCERPRNTQGRILESMAVRAGATRMAVWSEEAVKETISLGLRPRFQSTCCSLDYCQAFSRPRPPL
ncbi:MAG: hypothetical protein ACLFUE_04295 [Desulfobacteraceae bacterium]